MLEVTSVKCSNFIVCEEMKLFGKWSSFIRLINSEINRLQFACTAPGTYPMIPALTLTAPGPQDVDKYHRLVHAKNGACRYCKITGNRFECGLVRTSYYKCEACEVNLCREATRDCFAKYHDLLKRSQSDAAILQMLPKKCRNNWC